jgi:uncharacterized membrane protein YhfC
MNNILYLTYLLSGLLCICLAVGAGAFLTRRFHLSWRLFWIGGAVFLLSQVFHIPFNAGVSLLFREGMLPAPAERWQLAFNAAFLGLSAGIFEETARYLGYRWWAKEARTWSKGLLYGAGHGGFEAIIVGGLILLSFLVMIALQGSEIPAVLSPEQQDLLRSQQQAYWSVNWYDSLLGFAERAFALPVQLSLSILVLQAFVRGRMRWLFIAILWHALIDAGVVFSAGNLTIYLVEGIVALFGLASAGIIAILYKGEPKEEIEGELPISKQPPPISLTPAEVTEENLEETRYTD